MIECGVGEFKISPKKDVGEHYEITNKINKSSRKTNAILNKIYQSSLRVERYLHVLVNSKYEVLTHNSSDIEAIRILKRERENVEI